MTKRKQVGIVVVILSALMIQFHIAGAHGTTKRMRQEAKFQGLDEEHWTRHEVRHLILWAARRMKVQGGAQEALYVARHESGLRWDADNPYSSASGVYQIIDSTFDSWYRSFTELRRRLNLRPSVYNARTNVILSIRAASRSWCPWSATSHYC